MPQPTQRHQKQFYSRERSNEIPLCVNDAVHVIAGEYQGRGAAVISLESIGRDPTFLVEFGDNGQEAILPHSLLERDA